MNERDELTTFIFRIVPLLNDPLRTKVAEEWADTLLGSEWLAEHDRAVAERAWDECFDMTRDRWVNSRARNPHRAVSRG